MNPNTPDPNNPNSPTLPQADLGSESTPLPDLNSNPIISTPPQSQPAPILSESVPTEAPNPYPGFTQTPPATTPSFDSSFSSVQPAGYTPSDFGMGQTPQISPEPTPTFTPSQPQESQTPGSEPPMGFTWPNTESPTPPLENPYASSQSNENYGTQQSTTPYVEQTEPAPSDLSHLVNPTEPITSPAPSVTQPETLVSTSNGGGADVPNIPTENGHGIPKWVIGVGVGLLLAVVAASAYFILGIGKNAPAPESVPATQTESLPSVKTTPIPTIASPTASPSAGFGGLPGGGGTQASSAADLLRQRQNQQ